SFPASRNKGKIRLWLAEMNSVVAHQKSQIHRVLLGIRGAMKQPERAEKDIASLPDAGRLMHLLAFLDHGGSVAVTHVCERLGAGPVHKIRRPENAHHPAARFAVRQPDGWINLLPGHVVH